MIHSSNKNFTCNVCGKNFKQGSQLRNHEVSHLKGGENEDKLPNWYVLLSLFLIMITKTLSFFLHSLVIQLSLLGMASSILFRSCFFSL